MHVPTLPKSRKVRGPPSGEPVAAVVARGEAAPVLIKAGLAPSR